MDEEALLGDLRLGEDMHDYDYEEFDTGSTIAFGGQMRGRNEAEFGNTEIVRQAARARDRASRSGRLADAYWQGGRTARWGETIATPSHSGEDG